MRRLAITMGDPGGIGPEITVKAITYPEVKKICTPFVIGDIYIIQEALNLLKIPLKLRKIKSIKDSNPDKKILEVIHVIPPPLKKFKKFTTIKNNSPTPEGGRASVSYIKTAVELALSKQVDGIVTAPISKEALKMAGFKWLGHTEMLANLTKTKDYVMMLVGGRLRVILVTIHTALKNVPDLITKQGVFKTIVLAKKACDMLEIKNPKIAVAGLNPHAGESGIFGDEEREKIIPAIEEAKKYGICVSGPYPPDTVFYKAYRGDVDIVVCMYHDQGLIPLKMIAFESGVNVTVGLPFIRTSPDHGTAYDIAWKGIANPSSMIESIKLAARLKI